MDGADWTPAGLWLAVVASGLYDGINPGLGWPLAAGHLLAMLVVLLPFALLATPVSVVHSLAMVAAGGVAAWLAFRYLGLKFVAKGWFNLDATGAVSLILVGALSLVVSLSGPH